MVEGDAEPGHQLNQRERREQGGGAHHGQPDGEPTVARHALRPREPERAVLEVEDERRGEQYADQTG